MVGGGGEMAWGLVFALLAVGKKGEFGCFFAFNLKNSQKKLTNFP